MFSALKSPPQDELILLMNEAGRDVRSSKVDLTVGLYRDSACETPIMAAAREAERNLAEIRQSKSYVGPLGDLEYMRCMKDLVFGEGFTERYIEGVQTPGGSSAFRQTLDLIKLANPSAKIWISDPTYVNHLPTIEAVGLDCGVYPFLDRRTMSLKKEEMLSKLCGLGENDVVLFHGSCHNPSGVKLTDETWMEISEVAQARGFLPLFDIAYQGFGDGIREDSKGLVMLSCAVERLLVCVSCSKNFALYNDRVGCAFAVAMSKKEVENAQSQLAAVARSLHWVSPNNGAEIVKTILLTPKLKNLWENELSQMNTRIKSLRRELALSLREYSFGDYFDFITKHSGMFSMLPATAGQMEFLRKEYAIHGLNDGRINIAGLSEDKIDYVARSFVKVIGNV